MRLITEFSFWFRRMPPALGLVLFFAMVQVRLAFGTVIPPDRMVPWVPGVTVGVRGGIPVRTNLLDVVATYGADPTGFNDSTTNFANAIAAAQPNDVVYVPDGTYRIMGGIVLNKSFITLRGHTNSIIALLGAVGNVLVGPTALSYTQAKWFPVANGVAKGVNQLTLVANLDAHYSQSMVVGELYTLSTKNGNDPNFRVLSVYGFDRSVSQTIRVESVNGNTVTFSPPAAWWFTNSPYLVQLSMQAGRSVGLENLTITTTNAGAVGTMTDTVLFQQMTDSWMTNVTSLYANNYNFHVLGCVNCEMDSCTMSHQLSAGTSHAGLIVEQDSGCLFQDNIFDTLDAALQPWGSSVAGCAFFANFWTNSVSQATIFHNTHHIMNLFEANVMDSAFETDGYYGSNSHMTLLRNRIASAISLKRFSSCMNIVGNVLQIWSTRWTPQYFQTASHAGVFELGYPNIGNMANTGAAPPLGWNYPQTTFYGNHGTYPYAYKVYTNCAYTFTNDLINTTNLPGDFSNWPYSPWGGYSLIFQDNIDTNIYHFWGDSQPAPIAASSALQAAAPPTSTNMTLNLPMTISNGWTMYISSADTYQQLQSGDVATHILDGNWVYTNSVGSLVWDSSIPDTSIPSSLLYTNGPPSWWGSNRWPAIDPLGTPLTSPIPAQLRYRGIQSGTNTTAQIPSPIGLHIISVGGP